ncbi:MAG: cupin domain-containing protein [Aphanothece sp. CMT-3BRIN-NPC111]|nr:cupin domain-containing protein [Aphanothece sp. CMT-3BRIN-NPC111]
MLPDKNLNFEKLISPVETSVFFDKYWEQQPLVISGRDSDYYSGLFSLQELDSYLLTAQLKISELRFYSKSKKFTVENLLDKDKPLGINDVYSAYRQGNTVILNTLKERFLPVARLCQNLEDFFSCPVVAKLYLTPQDSQGFPQHFDTHDVFILQIEGFKQWRVYDAFCTLPIHENLETVPSGMFREPLYEVCLQPGDILYIPRGFVHEAMTSHSSSLHITIGAYVYRWSHVLAVALTEASKQDVRLRRSLPLGALNAGGVTPTLKAQFQEVLEVFSQQAQLEEVVEQMAQSFVERMIPLPGGHFYQCDRIDEVGSETVLSKRKGIRCHTSTQDDSIYIHFPGNTVKLPLRTEVALRFIVATESFCVQEIPGRLSTQSKLVLVRRLLQEGLLSIFGNS